MLLRGFGNKTDAMDYVDGTQKNEDDFLNANEQAHDIFVITQRNYREMMIEKSTDNYKVFYEKTYLKS